MLENVSVHTSKVETTTSEERLVKLSKRITSGAVKYIVEYFKLFNLAEKKWFMSNSVTNQTGHCYDS